MFARLHIGLALSLALLLGAGCVSVAWKKAKEADTEVAYRDFLTQHPHDDNAEAAKLRLQEIEFSQAENAHTALAYRRFIEQNPDAPQVDTAKALLETLRFNGAKQENTLAAWREFLQAHPDGAHHVEAQAALDVLQKAELDKENDPTALAHRFEVRPGLRTPELDARIDDATFAKAKASGSTKLFEYLDKFPAGAHRDEARLALLSTKLDGLLFSGLIAQAREEVRRSPLGTKLPDLEARFSRAERFVPLEKAHEPLAQSARPAHYLRDLADLVRAAQAPDPMDRWEAVEEMGQHISVAALDPLVSAFRSGRNVLVRERAFDSLANVLRALPPPVAEYEMATRIRALKETASSVEVYAALGALLDLSGSLDEAAQAYQHAFEPSDPDPVILWRWAQLREERHQSFSAAVAARQLAVWAKGAAETYAPSENATVSLASLRQLCAAWTNAQFASAVIGRMSAVKTDFPDDVNQFRLMAGDTLRLTVARLEDAELAARTRDASVRQCRDSAVGERLAAAVTDRGEALKAVPQKLPRLAPLLLSWSQEHDPSPVLRAQARSELQTGPAPSTAKPLH